MNTPEPLIFEKSVPDRRCFILPACDVPESPITQLIPQKMQRSRDPSFPEVSEIDIVRHFTKLSQMNYCVDTHFYPLGSCTMKYNPKTNEDAANLEGFTKLHPYQPQEQCQGILKILYDLEQMLGDISGMPCFTLQPAAGAHGELTGMLIIQAYMKKQRETRNTIIVPDSAHGTNPASAALCGYRIASVQSDANGLIDVKKLKQILSNDTAALMVTNPNTLGLFEKDILEISKIAHDAGALVYCDGANMNALLGIARPGDMGVDILHLNLHKTFSTPHGGGGPGAGPIGVSKELAAFLPTPRTVKNADDSYALMYDFPDSIGRVRAFYGHVGIMIRAYTYLLSLGKDGIIKTGENAVLNANYLRNILSKYYEIPYGKTCMHEFVISAKKQKAKGVSALDIAKKLLDYGFHAPTIYFPLIVEEALMVEPTETESLETLDAFAGAMIEIAGAIAQAPETVRNAPQKTKIGRPDEVIAARNPKLKWKGTG
ncbi:MAG: aminomethyl-transferring glycine dehydrogenase subunit GcvPB [Candidatus Kuenenia sp.]|nr:aminomethyl-transferring glycine dehydrogenase subunit GcvPB [Candidatus Kuenenia sp.]